LISVVNTCNRMTPRVLRHRPAPETGPISTPDTPHMQHDQARAARPMRYDSDGGIVMSREELLNRISTAIQELVAVHQQGIGLQTATLDFGEFSIEVLGNGLVRIGDNASPDVVEAVLFSPQVL
jgi:hypothetical protein